MTDIHNHMLYGVDDGADTLEESVELIREAAVAGVTEIIFTPHYRHGMFAYPLDVIREHFEEIKSHTKDMGVRLYLGCEYHADGDMTENLQSGRCLTLAGGSYVLTEYSHETETGYIKNNIRTLLSCGYIPVVAHVERYECFIKDPELAVELYDMGALIQVNADSVIGLAGRAAKKLCKKMLKNGWIDIVASDCHNLTDRANHLAESRKYIEKKYGGKEAERLFVTNPARIIESM